MFLHRKVTPRVEPVNPNGWEDWHFGVRSRRAFAKNGLAFHASTRLCPTTC
jgi:hypothetical protein